jgi:uncharacterized protein
MLMCQNEGMKEIPECLLEEITRRLVAEFDPEAIYLFGSHAWGEPTEDSDLDILVVVAWDVSPTHQDFVRAHHSLSGLGVPVDVLVKTRARFDRFRLVRASLDYKIDREGRLLYERAGVERRPQRASSRLAGEGSM